MISFAHHSDTRYSASAGRTLLGYVLVSAAVYWFINFYLTTNMLSPMHQDDYVVLGSTFREMKIWVERPVSTYFATLMGVLGKRFSYATVIALTVSVPALVLLFLSQLFRCRVHWLLAIPFSVLCFSHEAAFEHGKFLGLITNLLSHFFGTASLVAMMSSYRRPSAKLDKLALLLYALSAFCKEDFVLPVFLVIAFLWLRDRSGDLTLPAANSTPWLAKMARSFGCIAVASVLFSLLVKNPFTSGILGDAEALAGYGISFSPALLLSAFWTLTGKFSPWECLAGASALTLLLLLAPKYRGETVLTAVIIITLVAPYSLLSNHLFSYRVFSWLPWLAGAVTLLMAALLEGQTVLRSHWASWPMALLLCGVPLFVYNSDSLEHGYVTQWYLQQSVINKNIMDSLLQNKATIIEQNLVGVLPVDGLSPWSNSKGMYLQHKLGFNNRWLVFADSNSMFFTFNRGKPNSYIQVLDKKDLCAHPNLSILQFTPEGEGRLVRASELCTAAAPPG